MTCIRVAAPADLPAILAIYAPYIQQTTFTFEYQVPTPEEFALRMQSIQSQYPWLVLEENGVVVGYAYGSPFNERAAYGWTADLSVYLDMNCRGRGYGRQLYQCLMRLLQLQGVRNVYGIVTDPNPVSYKFHTDMGFAEKGHFEHIGYKMGRWLNVNFMAKDIAPAVGDPAPVVPFNSLPAREVEKVLKDYCKE